MAEKELAIKRLQQKHDTAQNWKVKNPILAEGELGVETDTGNIKAGNGTTTWNSLPYSNAGLGGGSADCLKTTGGVLNGTTEVSPHFFAKALLGELVPVTTIQSSVYRTKDENTGIEIRVADDILSEDESFEALGDALQLGGGIASLQGTVATVGGAFMAQIVGAWAAGITSGLGTIVSSGFGVQLVVGDEANPTNTLACNLGDGWKTENGYLATSVNGYTADSAGNIEIPSATTAKAGLMSSADKAKLDGVSGGSGGGDDGYFPSNTDLEILDSEMESSTLDAGGVIVCWKVYDSATSTHSPLKYILGIASSLTTNQIGMTVACDSFEEIFSIVNSGSSFMGLLEEGGSLGHINSFTFQGSTAGLGLVECVKSTEKPLWFVWVGNSFEDIVMPFVGYY